MSLLRSLVKRSNTHIHSWWKDLACFKRSYLHLWNSISHFAIQCNTEETSLKILFQSSFSIPFQLLLMTFEHIMFFQFSQCSLVSSHPSSIWHVPEMRQTHQDFQWTIVWGNKCLLAYSNKLTWMKNFHANFKICWTCT